MNGFINIYKKEGESSALAVAKVKRKLGEKCGHMGTLDPLAEGVLPVAVGKATRAFDYLLSKRKTYVAEFTFGSETDTLDRGGAFTKTGGRVPEESEILRVLGHFLGEIEQVPPNYSAKLIDGQRGYRLARKGVEFSIPAKKVTVERLELVGHEGGAFTFEIDCLGGTYIRALARDIAAALGTCAYMTRLVRTAAGVFTLERAVTVGNFCASLDPFSFLLPTESALSFPRAEFWGQDFFKLKNGVGLPFEGRGLFLVYGDGAFVGVGEAAGGRMRMRSFLA